MGTENSLKKSASDSGSAIVTRLKALNASELLLDVRETKDKSSGNYLEVFDN